MTGHRTAFMPRERRHTLVFLDEIQGIRPVMLDTSIDMTRIEQHRRAARDKGRRYSTISYVLYTAARVLVTHPTANAAVRGRLWPRMAWFESVNGKITLDKTLNFHRVVVSTVLRDLQHASLEEIQRQVDHFRVGNPESMPEFAPMRMLQRLPAPLARLAFRLGVRPFARRASTLGTFAVTSLGHGPVDGFYSVGGTTVTLGVGRTADLPVARHAEVTIAPIMRLSLTFDHRVIDGAEAADVLGDIKQGLESWQAPSADPQPWVDDSALSSELPLDHEPAEADE